MKKILIALAVLASVQFVAGAQNLETVKKNLDNAVAASQNAKKATKVATWFNLGNKYLDAYNAPYGAAFVGVNLTTLTLTMGNDKPVSSETVEIGGVPYTKQVYKDKNIYIDPNGIVDAIEITNPVVDKPLDKAMEAFKKAAEVDTKNTKLRDIAAAIKTISEKYALDAQTAYALGDIKGAQAGFEAAYKAAATQPYAQLDTNSLFNAAFTAWAIEDNAKAKDLFEVCVANNYYAEDGEVFVKLADIATKLDTSATGLAESKKILEDGFVKYPSSQGILIGLINYYLSSGEDTDKLFELLGVAKKNEPNNASLYYVEGNIHNQLGDLDKAVAAYQECSKINPDYEFGYYGEGSLYYNQAITIQDKAQAELDDDKYMALVQEFEVVLKKCIDPFEKAFEVTKDDAVKATVAEYLKNTYYRFRDQDAKYQAGYEKYDQFLKQ